MGERAHGRTRRPGFDTVEEVNDLDEPGGGGPGGGFYVRLGLTRVATAAWALGAGDRRGRARRARVLDSQHRILLMGGERGMDRAVSRRCVERIFDEGAGRGRGLIEQSTARATHRVVPSRRARGRVDVPVVNRGNRWRRVACAARFPRGTPGSRRLPRRWRTRSSRRSAAAASPEPEPPRRRPPGRDRGLPCDVSGASSGLSEDMAPVDQDARRPNAAHGPRDSARTSTELGRLAPSCASESGAGIGFDFQLHVE